MFLSLFIFAQNIYAACTGTPITWGGTVNSWNTAGNWSPANIPNVNTEDVTVNGGNVTENLTTSVGCVTINSPGIITGSSIVSLTFQGDSFTSNTAGALATWSGLTLVMGPHLTPANAQAFTFNQATTLKALTVASTSIPGGASFGATVTNLNAATATITTLANTGLNSSKYVGKITATTYTNTKANSLDITSGTFQVDSLSAANTVSGGSLKVNPASKLITTSTFNPVAGFTTSVLSTATLNVTTTSAPAGILNLDGAMTTTSFNPTATSTTTVSSTGTITDSGTSTPLGILNMNGTMTSTTFSPGAGSTTTIGGTVTASGASVPLGKLTVNGTLNSTTFAPTGTVIINAGGKVQPSVSSIATGLALNMSVSGTLTTPTFSPTASGAGSSITINNGGKIEATTTASPATNITIASGGIFNSVATGRTYSPTAGTTSISGTLNASTFNPAAGSIVTVNASPGLLAVTTTSTPAGTTNVNGTMTTPIYNPKTGSTTTVGATGSLTVATSSAPVGTASLSITGTMTTPTFTPAATGTTTINSGGLLSATTSATPSGNITVASGGTFNTPTYSPTSTSTTNVSGTMTVSSFTPGAGATINVLSGGVLNVTNFTPNATSVISVAAGGTLNIATINNALAATINNSGTMTVTNAPNVSTGTLNIMSGGKLIFSAGATLAGATLKVQANGTLEIPNGKTFAMSSGSFQVLGTSDGFPQNIATKGIIEAPSGSFNFTTTGGTLSLTGFNFDRLGINGLNIGGTTIVSALTGGQFTNLSTSYASVKVIQLNNSGTIPVTATNIAWNWGAFNNFTGTNPTSAQGYKLVSSTGCAGHSIDFTGWTGDWYETQPTFNVTTKISTVSCTVSLSGSVSAVSLLYFNAVPFNAAIDLRWRTNAERNHMGFNVYRSDIYSAQFQQINKTLLRNLKSSGSNQADYRFIDQNVTNGQTYYYYIEDVEVGGKKVLHGPVSATALASLGNPPADNVGENSDINPNDPINNGGSTSPAPIPNPTYEDLGNGVIILGKTSKSLRLEITPPAPVFSDSAWNATYQDVSIAGYSKMTTVGSPELPEKDILVEVQSFAQTAQVINSFVTENVMTGHLITPAPNYTLDGSGVLIPSYAPDATRYGSGALYPTAYFAIASELVTSNKSKYIKLKISPLKLNPLTSAITIASKIILDIGLNGDDWDVTPPNVNSNIGPYSLNNTLRIDYTKSGIYQISYDDFVSSQVDGPFKNSATASWRLYYKDVEIPLEISSANGSFGAGDYIRFYVPFNSEIESKMNQLILSPVNITEATAAPKRIEVLDVDPSGQADSNIVLEKFTKTLEQNLVYIDGITLNDSLDHFFYANLVNYPGMETLSVTTALPEIDVTNSENVVVKYYIKGRLGMSGNPVKHHVNLSIGGTVEGEAIFEENTRQVLSFEIPASEFNAGNNTLQFKVLGTFAPVTDNDFVLVDKIEIVYNGSNASSSGLTSFSLADSLKAYTIGNFSTDQILGYDITIPLEPKKMINLAITAAVGGTTFDSKFFVDDILDENNLKHFAFHTLDNLYKPSALSLNPGVETSLKNTNNRADLIVFGDENLINALQGLIDRRISQGLEVKTVTPTQVYGEFSFGVQKSKALKDFMNTAMNNWEKAPRFLLILGDGTYDPKDFNVNGLADNAKAVFEKGTIPAPIIPGRFIDFSSDNYFVSSNSSHLPRLSVGRLPTNDPDKIKVYAEKIVNYEEGVTAPTFYLKKLSFFADEDTSNHEHFNQFTQSMMTATTGFTNELYDRTELGSKALTKTKINNEFNLGPLMISMMGHGASDRFGDNIFNVTDARFLTNSILPIVVLWNCETAYFYDADKTSKSLGEELIFNPNGGAIVFMGSTTQTTPPAQAKLAQNFFSQLSAETQRPWTGMRFGDLLYQAKLGVGDGLYEKDIVNSFSIIGDPSLMMPAQLFPDSPAAPAASTAKKGMFGCTASASDGTSSTPWHEGLLEWIFYMFLIAYGTRKVMRMNHE